MGRLGTSGDEREQTLREIEAELESELGVGTTSATSRPVKRREDSLNWGGIALGALATYVATKIFGVMLLKLLWFGSVAVFLFAGGVWLWNQFNKKR